MANHAMNTQSQPTPGGTWVPEWSLADKFRKARQSIDLDQRAFAEKLGVQSGTYQQWEAGRARPRHVVATAKRIEMLTGISATWILGLETAEPRPASPNGAVARPEGFEPPTF
ncbi:helix-turn-helix domain-containing protein [Demequina sp. TTPB684]|uniref:helix-turn-helix domain-containing protein n=1 Tax=unclassified Demequina TaxID=2620311 RepID=UPI001CF2D52C|nr:MULTISPECIES: helix-turn-helix transcriptional regulator [unclassified Demequina]MCB2413683.1 helix-turn-helix domain-containing protein [Demequina sp. TTPB684]UPU87745.1 helix-turn-helix domain-containing protein [Demequina sp. TMPB413]